MSRSDILDFWVYIIVVYELYDYTISEIPITSIIDHSVKCRTSYT